jgi:cytochrome P450
MIDASVPARTPPESELQFNIGDAPESLERMCELHGRFGDIYRVFSPARRRYAYVINHPNDVRRVLVANPANYTKGFGLDRVKMLTGNGLVTSEGDFWRTQRYMMQPMFHRRVLTRFATLIAEANDRLLARWDASAQRGEPVNVTDDISALTLEVILGSIFGSDLTRLTDAEGRHPFQLIAADPVRDLSFAYRFRQLRKLVGELAQRRRELAAGQSASQSAGQASDASAEQPDFLGMLVAARDRSSGAPMGERELIDEVMTLIVAGHETAATTLNFTWYLLSQHPDCEARLHAELDALPEQATLDLASTESLTYARSVLTETLRLYPPVWLLSRRTVGPDVLAGYDIPAGVDVLLSPYLIHRHPQFWSDPDSFRPERPEAAQEARRPQFSYVPFSAGPRRCVGEALGMFEMCVHLYKIARRYRLLYPRGTPVQLEALINLRTREPLHMQLQRR